MKRKICVAIITALLVGSPAVGFAQDEEGKHKHHKFSEWLNALSSEERAKLQAAREQALKNPAVHAANERRKKADAEFYDRLNQEMERIDPSLKATLDSLSDLRKRVDEKVP
jgi:uncharacterized protein HemX